MEYVLMVTTLEKRAIALDLAHKLVSLRLAACSCASPVLFAQGSQAITIEWPTSCAFAERPDSRTRGATKPVQPL